MNQEKQIVSQSQYEKEIEKAASFLHYMERLPRDKAWQKAQEEVSQKYQVV